MKKILNIGLRPIGSLIWVLMEFVWIVNFTGNIFDERKVRKGKNTSGNIRSTQN
jgi:hypothetical protein